MRVGSNIAQNHWSSIQGVISGHYLPKFAWKVDQKLNYVKLESIRTLLRNTCLTHRKSCLIIIYPQFTWKDDQTRNYVVKLESIRTLLRSTSLTHRKSYLIIIYPNSHERLTKSEIRSSWTRLEYCSESLLVHVYRKSDLVIHYLPQFIWKVNQRLIYVKLESILTLLRITHLAHRKSYLLIICPNSHEKLTKSEIMSSWSWFKHCSESLV